jgi:hypothetical protein
MRGVMMLGVLRPPWSMLEARRVSDAAVPPVLLAGSSGHVPPSRPGGAELRSADFEIAGANPKFIDRFDTIAHYSFAWGGRGPRNCNSTVRHFCQTPVSRLMQTAILGAPQHLRRGSAIHLKEAHTVL